MNFNHSELPARIKALPSPLVVLMRDFMRNPTERSGAYASGYLMAVKAAGGVSDDDAFFWRDAISEFEGSPERAGAVAQMLDAEFKAR